ncbi:hypothetical protein [Streptomyces tsukubensis]|uniref:hypothetical protein n=1 Tax=Streptomyces tsukubensis TaxID=83656 RepID=UPI00344C3184
MRKRSGRPPRFAAVPNETVDDAISLDLEALGLLTVVLRHQDGFEITLPEIAEKYGYGRDSLAGSWGMLQVARYVVRVKIQWHDNNKWATEVVVYDTPATEDEIRELLASIAQEPNVRTAKLEPPTKTAQERAAKHAARVEAKQEAASKRRKLDFEVPCQAANTGRGRGSLDAGGRRGSGGTAPAAPAAPPRKSAVPKKSAPRREPGRRLTQAEAAAVKKVETAFPPELKLPSYRPPVLRDAILEALDSRSADVLIERVKRRWWDHGYAEAALPDGKGIGSPVGVAVALVRPSTDCPEPMCEDGIVLDHGTPCRSCGQRKEDRKRPVPEQRGELSGEDQSEGVPARRRWKCRSCQLPGRPGCEAPDDGLCGPCREEEQEVAAAAAAARERLAQAEARREELARWEWTEMVGQAYREHAEREETAAQEHALREAQEEKRLREAEEQRRLREQIARENPELLAYSQTR